MTFAERVYETVTRIPKGRVATYGQIAEIIGCPGGSRAVGNALHDNPYAPVVPCHRVVAANGSLAANFGDGGPSVQYERLLAEGVSFLDKDSNPPRVDLTRCGIVIERHPLDPFLPENATILFLGSFPPPKVRWSMDFFYPNRTNDFWRIMGLVHHADAHRFEDIATKRFDSDRIKGFCMEKGIALYDTAVKVCRWKGNASDEFLDILEPVCIGDLLEHIPNCRTLVTTGGKSTEELSKIMSAPSAPKVGESMTLTVGGKEIRWWRMPSTSRAYPMSLQAKAQQYAKLFGCRKTYPK